MSKQFFLDFFGNCAFFQMGPKFEPKIFELQFLLKKLCFKSNLNFRNLKISKMSLLNTFSTQVLDRLLFF